MPFTFRRAGSLALPVLLAGCGFSFHGSSEFGNGPETVARDFLHQIASAGPAVAYAAAAPQMRAAVGPNAFRAMTTAFGLDRYQSVTFTDSATAGDGTTELTGTLYERSALAIPVRMRVIANPGGWQVVQLDLHKPAMNLVGEGAADPGIALGTRIVTASELAGACRAPVAPVRISACVHSVPFQDGASSDCLGVLPDRMVDVIATLGTVDPATGTRNVSCRVAD